MSFVDNWLQHLFHSGSFEYGKRQAVNCNRFRSRFLEFCKVNWEFDVVLSAGLLTVTNASGVEAVQCYL